MVTFPNAKINLGLYITRKREDGFHDLETVFYPVQLCDVLEIIKNKENEFSFTTSGLQIAVSSSENLCTQAFQLIKKDFPNLSNAQMHLHKTIPMGAGLGGGSSDGAYALQLLNNKFQLNISQNDLAKYALQLGSDCPFFIHNKPCIAKGRGEILEEINLDLSKYFIVLIHPKIHINTGWAFSQIQPKSLEISLNETISRPVEEWKHTLQNDFEKPVFEKYPAIKSIKEKLYERGAIYASMSGSGSSVYGLFKENPESIDFGFEKEYFQFMEKLPQMHR
ncbi:4-(cytidine 5'-diphospho)-2-C-methyl-D-erythritol kinase [Arachidicoccus ginsenosidimutans]|uniref:4-(cytidine 5'-diphospho)-2-C-methyl-D-erythritol kinase n=1 Tax=Arachidicoccus sp. BS20 TaxID=1850526 RepID=UPI0007F0F271|nr:4-(cytidine 5'-diphospho)-2-C-methyl-D-erythritol kinase [Arachidicoccus sp. BS20]ANI88933.1 4-(cytidine 5'-diphospho)-2-C-methyl-D-erythritol kinase [Arachidicoccus sp. BS20]